jgi:hypothetical protein
MKRLREAMAMENMTAESYDIATLAPAYATDLIFSGLCLKEIFKALHAKLGYSLSCHINSPVARGCIQHATLRRLLGITTSE